MVVVFLISAKLTSSKFPFLKPPNLLFRFEISVGVPVLILLEIKSMKMTSSKPIRQPPRKNIHLKYRVPTSTNIPIRKFRISPKNNTFPRIVIPV